LDEAVNSKAFSGFEADFVDPIGRPIGSTLIDINFHSMISERLSKIASDLKQEPQMVADGMIQGRFERMKCSFGTAASSTIPTIPLPVPGLEPGCSFPDANIVDSKMIITRSVESFAPFPCRWCLQSLRDELKELFDSQIKRVISLMDEQFDRMQKNYTTTQIVSLLSYLMERVRPLRSFKVTSGALWRSWELSLCAPVP